MLKPITILFAEDHKLLRQLLISELRKHEIHTIGEAEDGIQLLELLKVKKPDIILLDIEMPNMNGSNTFDRIMKEDPKSKVIFLTTHNEFALRDYFYSKGAKAYLTKETDIEVIVETIRLVHRNEFIQVADNYANNSNPRFSKRESELIPLICEGKSNKEIADKLNIGNKTVEAHKKSLFKKTKTQGVVSFVNYILKKGLNYLR